MILKTEEDLSLKTSKGVIYYIQNKYNNKIYIGKTERTFFDRYPGGKWWTYNTNRFLKADYKKYGEDEFFVGILAEELDPIKLTALETYYIGSFQTIYPDGYNLAFDLSMHPNPDFAHIYYAGIVGKRCGMTNPDEVITKEELSLHIAATQTLEQKEKAKKVISKTHKGKTISIEQRLAISKSHKGVPLSKEHTSKIKQSVTETQGVPILRYSFDDVFIDEYPSINEAARSLGLNRQAISSAVNGKASHSGGFKWKKKI